MISTTDSKDKKIKNQPTAPVITPGIIPEPAAEKLTAEDIVSDVPSAPSPTVSKEPVKITVEAPSTVAQRAEPQNKTPDVSSAPIKPADAATVPLTEATQAESAVSTASPTSEELTNAMSNPAELETLVSPNPNTLGGFSDVMSKGLEEAMKQKDQQEDPSALPPTAEEEK